MAPIDVLDVQAGIEEGLGRMDRARPVPDPERDERVRRATESLDAFRAQYLPEYFTDEPAPCHRDVDRAIDEHEYLAIAEGREHGKSTRHTRSRALQEAATNKVQYILIVRRDLSDVKASILWLRAQFEENAALRRDFGDLTGGQPWTDTEFVLSNGVKVEGVTMGEPIMGKLWGPYRPGRIYVDDPQTMADVSSELIREQHKGWLEHQAAPALAQGGKLILCQNVIHEDCLMAYCQKNPMFFARVYDCIIAEPKRQDLWEQWEALYRLEHTDEDRHELADAFYAEHETEMNEGVELLWASHWTYVALMKKKILVGVIVFYTQYRNRPYTGDRAKYLAWCAASDVPADAERIEGFDLASSQAATSAKFAMARIAVTAAGAVYVEFAYEDRMSFAQQLLMVTESPHPMLTARVIETNAYQAVLADTGKETSLAGGAVIVSHHTSLVPSLRAIKLWLLMENGKMKFVCGNPAVAKLAQQVCSYRDGHMPDLMSALELGIDHALQHADDGPALVPLGDVMP